MRLGGCNETFFWGTAAGGGRWDYRGFVRQCCDCKSYCRSACTRRFGDSKRLRLFYRFGSGHGGNFGGYGKACVCSVDAGYFDGYRRCGAGALRTDSGADAAGAAGDGGRFRHLTGCQFRGPAPLFDESGEVDSRLFHDAFFQPSRNAQLCECRFGYAGRTCRQIRRLQFCAGGGKRFK